MTVCLVAVRLCTAAGFWTELCVWLQWGYVLLADFELNTALTKLIKLKRKVILSETIIGRILLIHFQILLRPVCRPFSPTVRYPSFYKFILLSIHPSILLSIRLYICQSVYASILPSTHLPIDPFYHPPIYHTIPPSVHSPSNPSTHPTTHPSNKPSIHPSIKNSIHFSIQILLDTLLHEMFNLTQTYIALIS